LRRGELRRGGIIKAGDVLARRVLIEGAWTYRMPARISRQLHDRNEELPAITLTQNTDADFARATGSRSERLRVPADCGSPSRMQYTIKHEKPEAMVRDLRAARINGASRARACRRFHGATGGATGRSAICGTYARIASERAYWRGPSHWNERA
jgi:hypothetical protein